MGVVCVFAGGGGGCRTFGWTSQWAPLQQAHRIQVAILVGVQPLELACKAGAEAEDLMWPVYLGCEAVRLWGCTAVRLQCSKAVGLQAGMKSPYSWRKLVAEKKLGLWQKY